MKVPNPNLLRFIRPARLQSWCAKHGVLTGRWTAAEIEGIKERAHERYEQARRNFH